jgi:predicted HAD superfamily Cof-like phosphohydrolase
MSRLADMLSEFHAALEEERGRGNSELRAALHDEEHKELMEELRFPDCLTDRQKVARELSDVVYVAFGTAHAFAIDLDAALEEIHRAAMSKLDPAVRVTREDGKILKPPGFIPPDMSGVVGAWASESTEASPSAGQDAAGSAGEA